MWEKIATQIAPAIHQLPEKTAETTRKVHKQYMDHPSPLTKQILFGGVAMAPAITYERRFGYSRPGGGGGGGGDGGGGVSGSTTSSDSSSGGGGDNGGNGGGGRGFAAGAAMPPEGESGNNVSGGDSGDGMDT